MEWVYPTKFTDKQGTEVTTIRNDGTNLFITLRGVQFSGDDFDDFEPDPKTPEEKLNQFTFFGSNYLCGYALDVDIEVPVLVAGKEVKGILVAHLELGHPAASGGTDREILQLFLRVNADEYSSEGKDGFFEYELLSLQRRMPPGMTIKMCFSCAYSDYSPFGHGLFGGMLCFRSCKAEYLRVQSKDDLFKLWGKYEIVQETYLCADFNIRQPNTGYRG